MAYERRRLSTESDKSSTSTTYSIESTTTYPVISTEHNPSSKKSTTIKRSPTMSSPAEVLLARTKNTFIDLNPYFQCSSLPSHWRKNKSLRFILRTKHEIEIKSNTRVVILAGNDYNPCTSLKNNISWFRGNQAEFNDLRFLGASGRGKKFTLNIIIETTPPQQCTYRRAIKITVDGPRKKRELKSKSDVNDIHGDESNIDADSDNETRTNSTFMMTDTKPSIIQGPSGLLLLAAAAEQKRKDEEDEPLNRPSQSAPMETSYLSNCLSPSTSLASKFSQSTISNMPTKNLILSLSNPPNRFEFYHSQQRRDQQTIVTTSSSSSSSNTPTSAHVLCR